MIKTGLIIFCSSLLNFMAYPQLIGQEVRHPGPADTHVVYKADHRMFPCKWRNKKTDPQFSLIPREEVPRMQDILQSALDKYPAATLRKNLKRIYVLKTLFFFGLEYGGTYYKRDVYITNNGNENGYTKAFIEGTFHHEFSSVLLNRYEKHFNREAWLEANPANFSYGNGGVEALREEETSLKLDSNLFAKGFLNEYSLASLEEDLNCFAEYIFLNDPQFWVAWEGSEAIRKKTAILIDFYQQISPVFTLEYFKNL